LRMVSFASAVSPTEAEIQQVLRAAEAAGPQGWLPAAALVQGVAPARRGPVFRGLAMLLKWGVLQVDPAVCAVPLDVRPPA